MRSGNPSTLKTGTSTKPNSTSQTDAALFNVMGGLLAIALPLILVCAIVGYRKYRAKILRQRVQRLNRQWQLGSSKELS